MSNDDEEQRPTDSYDEVAPSWRVVSALRGGGPPGPLDRLAAAERDWAKIMRGAQPTGPVGGPRTVDGYEAKRARGYHKVGGKTVASDGLVSRRGYRRILPEQESVTTRELWGNRAGELADVAAEVLHGRSATVFEGRVLNPLLGLPKRSVEDLAAQFGVSVKKIYKIEERARDRVKNAINRPAGSETSIKAIAAAVNELQERAEAEKCPTCGRSLVTEVWPVCRGAFADEKYDDLRPECLRAHYRTKEYERRLSELSKAYDAWWEGPEGRARRLREAARFQAEMDSVRAEIGLPPRSQK